MRRQPPHPFFFYIDVALCLFAVAAILDIIVRLLS